MKLNRKAIALTVAIALSHTAGLQAAQAAMIATDAVAVTAADAQMAARRAQVLETLNRADVAQALIEKGVDMDAARARVASLSDAEVTQLADQLDKAPAGASDILGVIVFIFVLLLITDILGFTKVFPFTRSLR
ncbi:MAG: PA2779 family protein [Aquabacterium sp.]|uniref:PA2779 family protein n=1 Tax=Aquabacterium sp. TaxID=1872578 RepID=UPI0025B92D36|nr:PA2779 family protein [Aquabacterium sp.]MBI3381362.1 PA2779 family protein [Aquabacterium sp.]